MNNHEAKQVILEADSCFCKHGAYKDCHSGCKYREALDAAVKALEQEPVLDKIRAEIADLDDADYDYEGYYKAVTDAVKIIDKYKADRSAEEGNDD